MSLDLSKLANVHVQGGKTIARCPACAEAGMDETGEHLIIQGDGRFGCVVHPGPGGKQHRQRIAKLVGSRSCYVSAIKVRAANTASPSQPTRIWDNVRDTQPVPTAPKPVRSLRNEPDIAPVMYALEYDHPAFREPENGEWIVGLYREDDGAAAPLLLWADTKEDRFWDPARREHVKPPAFYLRLSEQPQIDGETGYPIIDGAICPF